MAEWCPIISRLIVVPDLTDPTKKNMHGSVFPDDLVITADESLEFNGGTLFIECCGP